MMMNDDDVSECIFVQYFIYCIIDIARMGAITKTVQGKGLGFAMYRNKQINKQREQRNVPLENLKVDPW